MAKDYNYTLVEIRRLKSRLWHGRYSVPERIWHYTLEELQKICNGVGPEQFPKWLRGLITFIMGFLEAAAIVHDWEYTCGEKSYWNFTKANARLIRNAWIDSTFTSGLCAGILCQLFGWYAYKHATVKE